MLSFVGLFISDLKPNVWSLLHIATAQPCPPYYQPTYARTWGVSLPVEILFRVPSNLNWPRSKTGAPNDINYLAK